MSISAALDDTPAKAPEPEPTAPEASADPILDMLMSKIKPVSAIKHKRKILIYSEPGAGKTVFSATAPGNLILDVEDGLSSINNHPELAASTRAIPFKTWATAEQLILRLHENAPALADVETFTIDSASELHKKGLAETVQREWAKSPSLKNKYVAETEEHTENNEHIRQLISSLRDLDRNIIITAHARRIERKDKSFIILPDFSEKLAKTLAGIVDIVGYLELKEVNGKVERVLTLRSEGNIMAKTRFGAHPAQMVSPTWDKLFAPVESVE